MNYLLILGLISLAVVRSYDYCEAPSAGPSKNFEGLSLRQVVTHFRHGDRTPVHTYPFLNQEWDCELTNTMAPQVPSAVYPAFQKVYLPGRNVLPGNCYYGQLTTKGLNQHLQMGKDFQAMYSKYGLEVVPQSTWLRSSDVPRTLDSSMGLVSGFFGSQQPVGFQMNTMDYQMEDMWANSNICPEVDKVEGKIRNSTAFKRWEHSVEPFKKQIESILDIKDMKWGEVADSLDCTICHGMALPQGITPNMTAEMLANSFTEWSFLWNDPLYGKLGSGLFLGEIVQKMLTYVNGDESVNYVLYGGHDTTVGPLAALLQIADGYWPPYRSHIEFELWQNLTDTQFFVQMKYNGEVKQAPYCETLMCSWLEFYNYAIQTVPTPAECDQSSL